METLIAIITNAHVIDRYYNPKTHSTVLPNNVEFVHLCSVTCLSLFRTIYYGFRENFHLFTLKMVLIWISFECLFVHASDFPLIFILKCFECACVCVCPFWLVLVRIISIRPSVYVRSLSMRNYAVEPYILQVMKFNKPKAIHWFFDEIQFVWNKIRLSLTPGSILSRSKFRIHIFFFTQPLINGRIDLLRHIFQ